MEINFVLGRNGGHTPSSLSCRSIVVVGQSVGWLVGRSVSQSVRQMKCLQFSYKVFKFNSLDSKALFEWIYGANPVPYNGLYSKQKFS